MAGTRQRESAVDRIRGRVEEKAARRAAAARAAATPPSGDPDRPPPGAPSPEELPGIHADKPTQIPWRGWKQILKRAWAENKADNMPIIAGGVAFFGFLSLFPALIALISIYGLVAVEARNFVKLRATSLALTLGAIVFVLVTFSLVAVVPAVLEALPLGIVGTVLAQVARWALLLAVFTGSLAVLYRVAPDRDNPRFAWVSLGAVIVTVIWALVSVGFAVYVDNFGSYDKTYGTIAGVIVLMLWLYLTCYLVLLGAEINSEAEHQTAHDTTTGEPAPMGARGAEMADTLPESPEPEKGDSDPTRKN
jgi:uncharacterized BrkB/YihY/UPF0761 family membrane protein